jgi:hypothetical protein
MIAPTMEGISTSETSVNIYQTTRRNIPEDSHLHTRRRETMKKFGNDRFRSYTFQFMFR